MRRRTLLVLALFLLASVTGSAFAADTVPLAEMTAPWLGMLRSGDAPVRAVAAKTLVGIVRKHPAAASDLVGCMAVEENAGVATDYERCLVPLARESPATVSALIRLIREKETNYRARNFAVKVLSQVGPVIPTKEFVDAMSETYCPVPGAYLRVLRAMGKDAAPMLATAYRHPDANVRKWSTIGLRVIGRTEPTIQKLFTDLQAEGGLLLKLREGAPADRIAAITALAAMARTTPGTGTLLINFLKDVTDKDVQTAAQSRLIELGRESPEVVAALVAGIRSDDNYRVRVLAMKVLPKVGATLNCKETIEALGDDSCPVPGSMRRILITAGEDALPVLRTASKHDNPMIRTAAENILKRIPRSAVVGTSPQP